MSIGNHLRAIAFSAGRIVGAVALETFDPK
jgi:hypothetical protein